MRSNWKAFVPVAPLHDWALSIDQLDLHFEGTLQFPRHLELIYPHEFINNIVGIQSFVIAKAFMPEAIYFLITIIFGLPRRFAPRNLIYPHEFIKNIVGIQSFVIAKAFMPEAIYFFITIIFGLPRRFAPSNDIKSIEFYLKQADFFE